MPSVLITGCSSGFGLETAVAAARVGWQVFATMRHLDRRDRLEEAARRAGVTVDILRLDVHDPESIDTAVAEVVERGGGVLDAVVHNAGIADAGFFEDAPDEQVRGVLETNFFGVLALTRAVLPVMRAQGRGRIVVVSSAAGFTGQPGLSAYVASKWALEGWAESLAIEVAGFGIDIVLIEPGPYQTGIWDAARIASPERSPYRRLAEVMESRVRSTVKRRAGDPADVAARIVGVLSARRPRLRYPVGREAWIVRTFSHALPFSIRRKLIARVVGIPTGPTPPKGSAWRSNTRLTRQKVPDGGLTPPPDRG